MIYKWRYSAGWRRVTVRARTREEASLKAREILDKRCEKKGEEPPVGWTLFLLERQQIS